MLTWIKVAGAVAILVYLERRRGGPCVGRSNGTPCGPNSICWTGNGYTNACLEKAKFTGIDAEVGSEVVDPFGWLSPETWGDWYAWADRQSDFITGREEPDEGPITSPNDPRIRQ